MDGVKECRRCHEVKPLDAFHNRWGSKDGKNSYCKECANAALREWRRNNPERSRMHGRTSYQNNIDRRRAEGRAYYWAHKDYFAEYGKEYRQRKKASA